MKYRLESNKYISVLMFAHTSHYPGTGKLHELRIERGGQKMREMVRKKEGRERRNGTV
jgi:hypothetical protein